MLLIEAAAKQMERGPRHMPRATRRGHAPGSSRRAGYGELVDAAALLPVPASESVTLKQPKDFTLIGTPAKRLDAPEKVDGRPKFAIDTQVPGMKIAAIAISPVFGGKAEIRQ